MTYHKTNKGKIKELCEWITEQLGGQDGMAKILGEGNLAQASPSLPLISIWDTGNPHAIRGPGSHFLQSHKNRRMLQSSKGRLSLSSQDWGERPQPSTPDALQRALSQSICRNLGCMEQDTKERASPKGPKRTLSNPSVLRGGGKAGPARKRRPGY